jgi:hypothetical protein
MQTEIKAFQQNLDALQAVKSAVENAVNEAGQQGGNLFRDSEYY